MAARLWTAVLAAVWLGLQLAEASEVAAPAQHRPPHIGNSVHLRFRQTPVWLACDMRDSTADRFDHHAPAVVDPYNDTASMPDVVFRAFDTGTRYECQFEASEAKRAELRQNEMLYISVDMVMMKYEDEKWFSGDLPPFDCTSRRTALPRWLFDLEVRRAPAAEAGAEAALCAWNRHRLHGWRGLDALAPLALDFPDAPGVACALAPPDNFSAGTRAFTLPGLADPPFVCVFRTYRDFPGLVETQLQRHLDDLQRRLRASQEPQGNNAVRCQRAEEGVAEAPSCSSNVRRVTFTVRATGGFTARCISGCQREQVAAEVPAEEVILVDDADPVLNTATEAQHKAGSDVSLSDSTAQDKARTQRPGRPFSKPCRSGYRRSRGGCVPAH